MSKKLTIEFVRNEFESEGYTLLSTTYTNSTTKLEYECNKGHKHNISWSMWNSGNRCPYCTKKIKMDIEYIRKEFNHYNYILLTNIYNNNKQKLNYICPNGFHGFIRWNDWQQGHRCRCIKCRLRYTVKKPKKINFNYIKTIIESEGCVLLEDSYIGNRQRLKIKLNNGKEYYTTWLSWNQGKRPWRNPKNLQPTIEDIRKSFESKGYKLLSKEYVNASTKLEFICDRGHKHGMVWGSWNNGHICKYCSYENSSVKPKYKNKDYSSVEVKGIIYKAFNTMNDKCYIGQTVSSLHKRKTSHIYNSNKIDPKNHFHRALNKHGKDNFTWEIIEYCDSKEELDEMEFHYIKQYDSFANGYNMTLGGEGTIGRICEESTKRKISQSKTGRKASEETKKKLSDMRRGIRKSKEHVANVAAAKSRYWEITYPDGNIKVIRNLSAFCRENNLDDNGMRLVALYGRNHHKRFKCKRIDNIGEVNQYER